MKCPVCKMEVVESSAYCPGCGAKLPQGATGEPKGPSPAKPSASEAASADAGASLNPRRRPADIPEETLWEGSFSPKAVGCAVLSVVLLVVSLGWLEGPTRVAVLSVIPIAWFVLAGRLIAQRLGVHYKLTNQMFYHQRGVFTRVTNRIEVIDIDDVTYEQGLLDRAVNTGRVKVLSSGRTDPMFWLTGVEDVEQVARTIDKARRAERIRRGISVESLSTLPGV